MTTETTAPSMELEVSVDGGSRASADFSDPSNPTVEGGSDKGVTVEFNRDGTPIEPQATTEGGTEAGSEEGSKETTEGGEEAAAAPDLPDYNGSNEEVYRAYEDRVFTFDEAGKSTLNMPALETIWEANDGSLPDGMYAFLQDATGISKDAIKEIEAGRVALREKAETELYAGFTGGKEGFQSAFDWATTGGGYSAEQKERFNAVLDSGDPAAIKEAYELLHTRHASATKTTSPTEGRRRASPSRPVSAAAAPQASGTKPYADNKEYLADAKAKGFNNKEVRQRLEASSFWQR